MSLKTLPRLKFWLELGDYKSPLQSLEVRDQPLAHEQKRFMDAIGDLLSEMRKQTKIKKRKRNDPPKIT